MNAALDLARRWLEVGGWVMIPLGAVSVLALAIVLERAVFWLRLRGLSRRGRGVTPLAQALREGASARVADAAAERADPYARLARALAHAGRRGPVGEALAREAIESQRAVIERFQGTLSIIITAAPMLGILGTVTGIIASFEVIGGIGVGGGQSPAQADPALVAAGIARALYTTAFGLSIAVATLFPYAIFRQLADRALTRLELLGASAMEGFATVPTGGERADRVAGGGDRDRPDRQDRSNASDGSGLGSGAQAADS